jgi:hypothetical protein
MIAALFPLITFIFIIYYLIIIKKRSYISYDLKSGGVCYSCKDKIDISEKDVFQNLLDNKSNYSLCTSCKREEKLDEIMNISRLSMINKFKLYLIGEKYSKLIKILIFILIILCIGDITLKVIFDIKWSTYFYNIFLFFYWSLIIYRHKLISIKKTSEN